MNKVNNNLQDVFLNQARKDRIFVTIHLVNGFQLKGYVKGFDNFTIVLNSDDKQILINMQYLQYLPNLLYYSLLLKMK